jgi:hypothetical protein
MMTVTTVRDFSVIFDAYMQFEESMLSAKMEQLEEELEEEDAVDDDEDVRTPTTCSSLSSGSSEALLPLIVECVGVGGLVTVIDPVVTHPVLTCALERAGERRGWTFY